MKLKIFISLVLVFVITIPISQRLSSGLLVISTVFALFILKRPSILACLKQAWDLWIFVLILAFGLLYTADLETGFKVLETSLSILVMPIIFVQLIPFDKNRLNYFSYGFTIGLFAAFAFCIIQASLRYSVNHDFSVFYGDQLTSTLENTHAIYFAYYLIFVITFWLYALYYEETTVNRFVIVILLTFFFCMIFLIGSSTAIVSVLFSLLYFILKYVFEDTRTRSRHLAFFLSLIFLFCLFALNSFDIVSRYGLKQDNYWERFVLWESALHAMPNWVVGVGTGDYMAVLNEYYNTHHLSNYAESNLNPHNQFIETLFSVGIPGLLALILMIFRPIYMAVRTQNIIGFLTFFPFLIYGMTEVFLGRYQGVVFFSMLHQAFISYYQDNESHASLKDGKF